MSGPPDDLRFCSRCGGPLELRQVEGQQRPVCRGCGAVVYLEPKLVAAAVVARDQRVLLVRRAINPGLGLWGLPGGYVDRGEVVEEAVCREVREETGLEVEVQRLLGLYSEAGAAVVLAVYEASIAGGRLQPGAEVLEADFFSPEALPPLAFPRDLKVLQDWKKGRTP